MTQFVDKAGLEVALDKIVDRVDKAVASINPDGPTITHTMNYSIIDEDKADATSSYSKDFDITNTGYDDLMLVMTTYINADVNYRANTKVVLVGADSVSAGDFSISTSNKGGKRVLTVYYKDYYVVESYVDVKLYGINIKTVIN